MHNGTVVPVPVRMVVEEWRSAGSPAQDGIAWPRGRWIERLPGQADVLRQLPDRLTRSDVLAGCQDAARRSAQAVSAFVVVMAWGYGRVGYGPFRVGRLLDASPDAGDVLAAAASVLAQGGPVRAYGVLGDLGVPRLHRLGPAFGTKYLYFCTGPGAEPALILDRLVASWLRRNTDLLLNEARWSVRTYQRYLDTMRTWADELGIVPGDLEECIFSAQARSAGSQWGAG